MHVDDLAQMETPIGIPVEADTFFFRRGCRAMKHYYRLSQKAMVASLLLCSSLVYTQPTQALPDLVNTQQISTEPLATSYSSRKAESETKIMLITAYTKNDRGMNGKGITASGEPVQEGVTVAAPEEIPLGSKIYIPALDHTYLVTDRGGAIKGDRLDLFMESRERALEFGKQRLEVVIISN